MGFLSSIFGGTKGDAQQVRLSEEEGGFVDLDIPLSSRTENTAGSVTLIARGILAGRPVGFSIEIHPDWRESPIDGTDSIMYWGRVTFRAIGPASDNFISALADLYGLPAPMHGMLPIIEAEAVGLASDPRLLETKLVQMKLFFNSSASEELYAEVFLNTNVPGGLVQFHEKDPVYRKPLLRALYAVA